MNAFNCPQCGASLELERTLYAWVRCSYCNSSVLVPAELRTPPEEEEEPPAEPPPPPPLPPRPPAAPMLRPPDAATLKTVGMIFVPALGAAVILGILLFAALASLPPPKKNGGLGLAPTPGTAPTPAPKPKPDGYDIAYIVGGEGTGPGRFKDEMSVAVDGEGRVYVSDGTRRVQRFDAAGRFLNTWNIPAQTKWYSKLRGGPQKLLAGEGGQLYAVLAGVVLKLDGETGAVLGAAHGSDYIHDAAAVPGGGLLIVSQKGDDDELVLMGTDGRAARRTHRFVSSLLDKRLEVEALRVAAGAGGETYALYAIGGVAGEHWYDDEDLAVFKFNTDGKYTTRIGGGGSQPGQFGVPSALAADLRHRVYVCEPFDKIHVYESDGRYVRTLKTPHAVDSLAFDAQNNLYVAGGHNVSKLILDK